MKRYQHHAKNKGDRLGFYVALSVCMVAVGLAFWSAYTTITDTSDASDNEYFSSLTTDSPAPVAQEMTGVMAETSDATQPPATAETETPTQDQKSIKLYESVTLPKTEDVDMQSELDALSAVLRVNDSLIYPVKSHSVLKQYSETAVLNKTMQDYRAHTGCDFVAGEGENVYAMCPGTVKNISVSELYGVIVEVESDGFSVYYCGLDPDLSIEQGDDVNTGDTIGVVGTIPSESADDTHIHVEVRSGGKLIDPMTVIQSDD